LLTEGHYFSEASKITEEYINYAYLRLVASKEVYINNKNLFAKIKELNVVLNKYLDLKKYTLDDANESNISLLGEANLLFRNLVSSIFDNAIDIEVGNSLKDLEQKIDDELAKRTKSTSSATTKPVTKTENVSLVNPPYISRENKKIVVWITKRGKKGEFHWDPNCLKVTNPPKGTKVEKTLYDSVYYHGNNCTSCRDCNTPFLKILEQLNKTPFKFLKENPDRGID
jgi:hypothetical protein